jgi:hypothetical protein
MLPDAAAVGRLRDEFEEVRTWSSGQLLRSLLAEGLVDRVNLWMYPHRTRHGQAPVRRWHRAGVVPAGAVRARPD